MKTEQVVEHIRQIWTTNPLPTGTAELAVTTIQGIEQQLATGSKSVHYMTLEDGQLHIRLIKVTA
jgi:hypothetical protein